ncbi:hypothetical protein [Clostridium sp.]|uniref:glucosamine inositolphosphorylceramide transferase family protein n=1 Tax=Clostridium sp. TaxID=1506 RepID=UPI00290AA109|nr:hypothetical protein [Clostridium sp.]MDU3411318.1 hypothetical protein [Clostridium sp.]
MVKKIENLFKKLFIGGEWSIAFKNINHKDYQVKIENNKDYWGADPFLWKYKGDYYLFCEKYLRNKDKGVIGVFKIEENFKLLDMGIVLEENYHLSYPQIFSLNGTIYMIPESSGNHTVDLYKCVEFPMKWVKCKNILRNIYAVDTNTIDINEKIYMITYVYKENVPYLQVYIFDEKFSAKLIYEKKYLVNIGRGAGNIFINQNKLIRPTQNQKQKYGESVIFNEILDIEGYTEKEVGKLTIDDISVIGQNKYKRIHTYNRLDDIEVIDVRSEKFDMFLAYKKMRRRLYNNGR